MGMMRRTNTGQPVLRLVESENLDRCSSYSLIAASPRGSEVRSCSMSLTDDGASPIRDPISAKVSPVERRSEMRVAQLVMPPSIRESVELSQRRPVTVIRKTSYVPRPKELPSELNSIGARVRWWRKHRRLSRSDLSELCGMSLTALSDLELERTTQGRFLHQIAAHLRLNPHYLQTGKGEPEAEYPQEAPVEPEWPFQSIPRSRLDKLNIIERRYAESALDEALNQIEIERRKAKRQG